VLVRLLAMCEVKWQVTVGVRQSTCCSVYRGPNECVCVCVCVSAGTLLPTSTIPYNATSQPLCGQAAALD